MNGLNISIIFLVDGLLGARWISVRGQITGSGGEGGCVSSHVGPCPPSG